MDYDVLILGGGLIGCSIAYELSKYSLNIALIEKDYDIADDIALFNSSMVYDGIEADSLFMSKLESQGNRLFSDLCEKIHVPFRRCNSLIVAENETEEDKILNQYKMAIKRGIRNIKLLNEEEIRKLELKLKFNPKVGLYSSNTGIVCPYDLAIAYGEIAFDNGVKFKLEEEVIDIEKINKAFRVTTNKNKFTCKVVINTIPGDYYSVDKFVKSYSKKSYNSYFVIDKSINMDFKQAVFILKQDENKIFAVKSIQGNTIIILNTRVQIAYHNAIKIVEGMLPFVNRSMVSDFYQEESYEDDIVINENLVDNGYIKVIADHYAQVTITPAISKMICGTVTRELSSILKKDFIDKRREIYRFNDLDNIQRNNLIKMDSRYGNIICRCNYITEGEIIDSIRRPLGARTLEGIKRRTGVTFGRCKGADCMDKVVNILAREMNKKPTEIVKDSRNSFILEGRIKEF